jgi:hypothetical protein
MEVVLAAIAGALVGAVATSLLGLLSVASGEVRRHDLQVSERDKDLEEWIVIHHRKIRQRWHEIEEQANEAGVLDRGTVAASRAATQTLLLYDYREELRTAHAFVRRLAIEERWTHRFIRLRRKEPFPGLTTPSRAGRLIDYWEEGTARNALTWSLDDILAELPQRATSRARAPGIDPW